MLFFMITHTSSILKNAILVLENVSEIMTRSKRIDSKENEGPSLKTTNDVLTEEDEAPKKIKIPTDGCDILEISTWNFVNDTF